MKKYHYVYKTTNNLTGKFYIGVHSTNILNDKYYGSGIQIKQAIKKYGKNNFTFEILKFCKTREDAFVEEFNLVNENVIKDSNSYNMMIGGLGGTIKTEDMKNKVSAKLKGRKFSEEHRKKIGEANRKRIISEETKNKLRGENNPMFGKTGDKNPSFGKKHSIETKKKISENRKNSKVNLTDELRSAYSNACKGKIWYNDGKKSKRFYENQQPSNYTKGRV